MGGRIIQPHIDETIVGEDLTETDNKDGALIAVPVALVNDRHFWGVLPSEDNDEVCPVDKGDYESLRSQVSKGLCSSSHGHTSPTVDHSDELDDGALETRFCRHFTIFDAFVPYLDVYSCTTTRLAAVCMLWRSIPTLPPLRLTLSTTCTLQDQGR